MTRPCRLSLFYFIIPAFLLVGCDQTPELHRSKDEIVAGFEKAGPKLEGVDDTLLKAAQKAEQDRQYDRAAATYQQLSDKHPDQMDYRIALADNQRRIGRTDDALKNYDAVLAKNPGDVTALEGKMLGKLAKRDMAAAAALVQQILQLDPKRWRTLNAGGLLFASKNLPEDALKYYSQALTISPDNPSILNNVGLTLAMSKQYDKAIEALLRGSNLSVQNPAAQQQIDMNLALVYGLAGKMGEAEKIASKYLQGPALYNNLGYYAHLARNQNMAKDYLNMALTKSPTYYERAWNNLESLGGGSSENKGDGGK